MTLKYGLLAALLSASVANVMAEDTFYVQGDLGVVHFGYDNKDFKVKNIGRDLKKAYKESTPAPRVSMGFDSGDVRLAADYTMYQGVKESFNEQGVKVDARAKAHGLGVSLIYDIPVGTVVQPYVGARLSVNQVKADATAEVNGQKYNFKAKGTGLGVGVLAGVDYHINQDLTLDLGYRYNRLSSDASTHEASLGLRYYFK